MPTCPISFEVFPPRSTAQAFQLRDTLSDLSPFSPEFVSVTFGAGGSAREASVDALKALTRDPTAPVIAAHLTAAAGSRSETLALAAEFADMGVTDLVALRGDAPKDGPRHADAFESSVEMVEALSQATDARIFVGAYPDGHGDEADLEANARWLKRKFEAGAHAAITQFFFEADSYFRFRDICDRIGITNPIIPGILPVHNWAKVRGFAEKTSTPVPDELDYAFSTAIRDGRERLLALSHATELCDRLVRGGAPALHFYTLNRADLTRDICSALGHTPMVQLKDVA